MITGKAPKGFLTLLAVLLAGQVAAAPISYIYTDNTVVPSFTSFGNISEGDTLLDTYYGSISYSKICASIPVNIQCNYAIEARIHQSFESPPYQNLELSIGAIRMMSGGGLCDSLEFRGLEWEGLIPHTAFPSSPFDPSVVAFPLATVEVEGPCGICSGSLSGSWSNGTGGTIGMVGSLPYVGGGSPGDCNVSGSFTQIFGSIYGLWH